MAGKSREKSKEKMMSNRGYIREATESPSKEDYQKMKKNLKALKRDNISNAFISNTYNLNVVDHWAKSKVIKF